MHENKQPLACKKKALKAIRGGLTNSQWWELEHWCQKMFSESAVDIVHDTGDLKIVVSAMRHSSSRG